jgi:hypothetical protein
MRELDMILGLVDPEWGQPCVLARAEFEAGSSERDSGIYPRPPGPPPVLAPDGSRAWRRIYVFLSRRYGEAE